MPGSPPRHLPLSYVLLSLQAPLHDIKGAEFVPDDAMSSGQPVPSGPPPHTCLPVATILPQNAILPATPFQLRLRDRCLPRNVTEGSRLRKVMHY
eukprot:6093979-Pleurochrysis_carterae.AAC.1